MHYALIQIEDRNLGKMCTVQYVLYVLYDSVVFRSEYHKETAITYGNSVQSKTGTLKPVQ